MKSWSWLLALALLAASPTWGHAAQEARAIVAFKPDAPVLRQTLSARDPAQGRADRLAARAGLALKAGRSLGPDWQVVRAAVAPGLDSAGLARRLAADPDVAWAVPDLRRRALAAPNDPLYPQASRPPSGPDAGQWYLRPPDATFVSAANLESAWDRVTGSPGVVVAVIDTGVRPDHLDLDGVLLPGIDTIDDVDIANDGDRRDDDPSDPGDWVTLAESSQTGGPFQGCGASSSSWHGTLVTTLVGAVANDGIGMAGAAYGVRVLPVRALGKCGGYDSDIIAGMLWAAGLQTVVGRSNANPARVLNLSLGASGACTQAYIDAVARINATGAVVVAAAGNDAGLAVGTPANCPGVIGVGGLRHAGSKVGFSDLGPEIALSAPGGNCVNTTVGTPCLYPILAGGNSGLQAPNAGGSIWTDSFDISVGTSFAAPIVAGAAALVLTHRPMLTPDEVRQVLQSSARPFPQSGADNGPSDPTPVAACLPPSGIEQLQCYCPNPVPGVPSLCGAGMLDADAAVVASAAGFARITVDTATPAADSPVQLSSGSSLAPLGGALVGQTWTVVDGGGIVTDFDGARNAAEASFTPSAAGDVKVRLTVTDDAGGTASTERTIAVAAAPPPPPPPVPSTGGGALGGGWLLALAAAAALLRRQR